MMKHPLMVPARETSTDYLCDLLCYLFVSTSKNPRNDPRCIVSVSLDMLCRDALALGDNIQVGCRRIHRVPTSVYPLLRSDSKGY